MSDKHYGLGVLIGILAGNKDTVNAHNRALNKSISKLNLENDMLIMEFDDGTGIWFFDDGQSCCESRYMTTDDKLSDFIGSKFAGAELRDAPSVVDQYYGEHEIQFLIIHTDKGDFTMESHNEHNGYYGGFLIVIQEISHER